MRNVYEQVISYENTIYTTAITTTTTIINNDVG